MKPTVAFGAPGSSARHPAAVQRGGTSLIVRFAFPAAMLSAGSVILLIVLGGAAFPGYSHTSQFISELGATGAPHEKLVRFAGFLPAGVLLCLFVIGAFKVLPRSHLTALGLAGNHGHHGIRRQSRVVDLAEQLVRIAGYSA
jgi:hypothetical protein